MHTGPTHTRLPGLPEFTRVRCTLLRRRGQRELCCDALGRLPLLLRSVLRSLLEFAPQVLARAHRLDIHSLQSAQPSASAAIPLPPASHATLARDEPAHHLQQTVHALPPAVHGVVHLQLAGPAPLHRALRKGGGRGTLGKRGSPPERCGGAVTHTPTHTRTSTTCR